MKLSQTWTLIIDNNLDKFSYLYTWIHLKFKIIFILVQHGVVHMDFPIPDPLPSECKTGLTPTKKQIQTTSTKNKEI